MTPEIKKLLESIEEKVTQNKTWRKCTQIRNC